MDNIFEKKLNEYAKVVVEVGIQVKPGDTVVIESPVDCAQFARLCTSNAYDAGAKEVIVHWKDDFVARQKFLRADDEVFDSVPEYLAHLRNDYALQGASFLMIRASDPNLLNGVDSDRIKRSSKASFAAYADFYKCEMNNEIPWCIASVPEIKWARTVFPTYSDNAAMAALWEAIFETVRVTGDGHAALNWKEHIDTLNRRAEQLNEYNFKSLHYTNSLGTDLVVELPEGHLWASGEAQTPGGKSFVANMPTEEVFSAPLKTGANGVVYASKPLSLNGNVIEDFYFIVKNGKIVEAHAKKGEDVLINELDMDEGARYFGEVALVPFDSPISRQDILYYETLFDENASCHIAFGEAYPECLKGGNEMDEETLQAHGLNKSNTYVDFMIGTRDLSIVGTKHDGKEITVFENGNFVF